MRSWRRGVAMVVGVALCLAVASPGLAGGPSTPYGGTEETRHLSDVERVYYPFLIVGHGALVVAKYAVAYPIWFLFKPALAFLYQSSEDPNDLPQPRITAERSPDPPAP